MNLKQQNIKTPNNKFNPHQAYFFCFLFITETTQYK
jgi:hypothetical protein